MGRADANFNYCISWDCGGATVGDLTGVRSPLPYADCAYLIGHFYRILARRAADYRSVYVFGHAAVVYGRRHQILFQSAYVAEVVRGGLQALPKGQYEAAESLALGYWKTQGLVILPQALKLVIPGLVNTIIALFKDTSLVIIIGLFDLFSSVQQATVDPAWLGMSTEGYVFAALIYWIFCFSMSRYSQHLEKRFNTGRTPH